MKCIQKACTITYKGKRKDRRILNCVPFIENFGEDAVRIATFLIWILPLLCLSQFTDNPLFEKYYLWIPYIFISSAFYVVGVDLHNSVKYVEATRCKKCGQNYGYEEREKPDIKEVSTEDSYNVTITRYWKCKYCGYRDSKKSTENIRTQKGDKRAPKEIECEKCGKIGINAECRNPDIKIDDSYCYTVTITTRYYKCKYCGHVNIEAEKREVNSTDNSYSVTTTKGKDLRILN